MVCLQRDISELQAAQRRSARGTRLGKEREPVLFAENLQLTLLRFPEVSGTLLPTEGSNGSRVAKDDTDRVGTYFSSVSIHYPPLPGCFCGVGLCVCFLFASEEAGVSR